MADAAQPTDHPKKPLFCTSQQLSLLSVRTDVRRHLSGERFHQERHAARSGEKAKASPWKPVDRWKLVERLTAGGDVKRLAVVCAAGLGKSTNLEWVEYRLAVSASRQTPFLFELDDDDELPQDLDEFWNKTLPGKIGRVRGNAAWTQQQIMAALARYRAQGRITLLLDSIDQATPKKGWPLVYSLLNAGEWDDCPIVVSARPHAVFDQWDTLVEDERGWRFVRVEPLEEEQRKLLLNHDGVDRYSQLPAGGRELMANPRHIEYVLKGSPNDAGPAGAGPRKEPNDPFHYTLADLRTASHVFAGAADHMIRRGMTATEARFLNASGPHPKQEKDIDKEEIDFAHNLLGALAYTMYLFPLSADQNGPNVSHVPNSEMAEFRNQVLQRLRKVGRVDSVYTRDDLKRDIRALAALNEVKYDLLDNGLKQRDDFRWYDRSLQEFYAAWWLSRYADDDDIERLRQWRYNDPEEKAKKSLYEPLWGFLVEMPRGVRQVEMPRGVRKEEAWLQAVGVLFEPKVARCCEMIHRSWPALSESAAGIRVLHAWRQEFQQLLDAKSPAGDIARGVRDGLLTIPEGICHYGADPPQPGEEHFVKEFRLHQWPVTNAMYELFDPGHFARRWDESTERSHPLAGPDGHGDDRCPVVNVTWYNVWSFAAWCGYRLPTEREWEHAARARTATRWFFGDNEEELKQYAHYSQDWDSGSTRPVAEETRRPNPNGLFDMLGNVFEWCEDRSRPGTSARVLRGGSWDHDGRLCRSAYRGRDEPGNRTRDYGFRLAAVPASLEPGAPGSGA